MKILLYIEKILAIAFWSLAIFGFDLVYIGFLTLFSALMHEIGHIVCLFLLTKRKFGLPEGRALGLRLNSENLSYKEEIFVAAAGPSVNLILALVFLLISQNSYFLEFSLINLLTMLSNLFPIEGYDGYKILHASISIISNDSQTAEKILPRISFIISAFMCFIALYIMLKLGEGYWAYGIFLSSVISFILKKRNSGIL